MEETNFFKKANTTQHLIYSVCALAMIALGIYLTNHYYAVKFPEGLTPTSMCDINSYFNWLRCSDICFKTLVLKKH